MQTIMILPFSHQEPQSFLSSHHSQQFLLNFSVLVFSETAKVTAEYNYSILQRYVFLTINTRIQISLKQNCTAAAFM